ncbi:MAG: YbhB/YbcL family Raf kinase inhibitor-like protein [Alphaproteobacteria bacterium]|nr:YbhB/YbcL family Raf kinase inhibitor-like protein [Alphaproteobacteria bacterium]
MLLLLALACKDPAVIDSQSDDSATESAPDTAPAGEFSFSTPSWEDGGAIPAEFTCDGQGGWNNQRNPELVWENPPEGTAAYALTYIDLTANGWQHWAFYTEDASLGGLPQESSNTADLPAGVTELVSNDGRRGYVPNCPGGREHTYEFTLWALSEPLAVGENASFGQLRNAAENKALGSLSFTGLSSAGG